MASLGTWVFYWRVGWDEPGDGQPRWALLGDLIVPEDVAVQAIGLKGTPDADIRFSLIDGRPEVVRLDLHRSEDGRGLRAADLAGFSKFEDLARVAFMLWARIPDPDRLPLQLDQNGKPTDYAVGQQVTGQLVDWNASFRDATIHVRLTRPDILETRGVPDPGAIKTTAERERRRLNRALDAGFSGKRRVTNAELDQVAYVYQQHINNNPTEAVQDSFGYTKRTASRRVTQARQAGLLPPTTQGKKQA